MNPELEELKRLLRLINGNDGDTAEAIKDLRNAVAELLRLRINEMRNAIRGGWQ